jgi:hypothetical protein
MIPYAVAGVLVTLAAIGLLAAWHVHSRRSRSGFAIDSRSAMRGAMDQTAARDRAHCDACRYERDRIQLAARIVSHAGAPRRQETWRIAPRGTGFRDPGRSRREPWLSRRPGSTDLAGAQH